MKIHSLRNDWHCRHFFRSSQVVKSNCEDGHLAKMRISHFCIKLVHKSLTSQVLSLPYSRETDKMVAQRADDEPRHLPKDGESIRDSRARTDSPSAKGPTLKVPLCWMLAWTLRCTTAPTWRNLLFAFRQVKTNKKTPYAEDIRRTFRLLQPVYSHTGRLLTFST